MAFLCSWMYVGATEVRFFSPLRPRLPLRGNERVLIAPFVIAQGDAGKRSASKIDLQGEFRKYLTKQLGRNTRLEVGSMPELALPTQNVVELGRAQGFWQSVGASSGAEIIVSGSLEYRVEDRSGYKTEEYVSPVDGKTYFRQIYIEQSGASFEVVILAFDGRTGEKIFQDQFRDFRQAGGRKADDTKGLFENLFSLENQILNIFVTRVREARRHLLSP